MEMASKTNEDRWLLGCLVMCVVFVYKLWVVSYERIMSKNIKEDEIPLTFSSPALSETKAKFDSLLRVAIEKYPKEKKKFKGVEERRKPKQKPKIVHSSLTKPEASEGYSLTYGSSSQLLPHDAEFSSSREEEAVENPSKANRHSQNQIVDVSELIAIPENHKHRNNKGGADRRTDLRKWSSDGSPCHEKHDADVAEESFEGENSSGSVDNRSSIKRPVPLPRIRTRVCSGALVSNSVTSYKSEDESGTDTHKSLVVEALVSAADGAPFFTNRRSPGTRNAGGRLELQSYEEIQMAELNSPKEKPPGHKVSHKISKKGKRTIKKHYDSEEEAIVTNDVARVCDPIIDSLQMENTYEPSECTGTRNEPAPSTYSYEKIVGVFVHNSDCLQPDLLVRHPLVKVHLICADTGQYLKKSSVDRSVSFFYENETVDYILPLMTESYNFRQRRSILPSWEELLVFNEDIEYILNPDLSVVIMFEILDFVSFSLASARYKKLGTEGGWYKIAWAFLKPVGKNAVLNVDKKLRLQLYKPQSSQSFSCDACEPYLWWSSGQWSRYPGSLYVTVKGIHPPGDLPPALRSRSALQSERGSCRIVIEPDGDKLKQTSSPAATPSTADAVPDSLRPNWSRLPSQSCRVPNRRALTLNTPPRGCFAVSFSSSGLFLACTFVSQHAFAIAVFTIPEGMEYVCLPAHQGLVYDLHWSHDDAALLSASADCTACVWDVRGKRRQPSHMLPHPSFVYCAQFHPTNSSSLITGCCDSVTRVWTRSRRSKQYELSQELERHVGFVNTLCFDRHFRLFTGDSEGKICVWHAAQTRQKHRPPDWELEREICVRELRGTVINKLVAHPGGQRLLVHARDSLLRMLDVSTGSVVQWFSGALNHRLQTSACVTPCGSLVWAASEDGTVWAWHADTGERAATYTTLGFHSACTGVDYHPQEHMVAFCSHGSAGPVVVCDYDRGSSGRELGLWARDDGRPEQPALPPLARPPPRRSHMGGDSNSTQLSAPPSESADSERFASDAESFRSEKRLATILEKIDEVLSLPSARCAPAVSSGSLVAK